MEETEAPNGVSLGERWGLTMAKYGPKAQQKVEQSLHDFKRGNLKSGSGHKVNSRRQAIAIGLSEARKSGAKVPSK